MLKLTAFALGLLSVIAIAPASQAATPHHEHQSFDRPVVERHDAWHRREVRREVRHHSHERVQVRRHQQFNDRHHH
jgi:hypothetical protein